MRRRDLPPAVLAALGVPQKRKAHSARRPRPLVEYALAIEVTLPLVVVSEANRRDHWSHRYRRGQLAKLLWLSAMPLEWRIMPPMPPWRLTFTRLGGRHMDSDNLAISFKSLRDIVCYWLRVDDGDEGLTFVYQQELGGLAGVRVRMEQVRENKTS